MDHRDCLRWNRARALAVALLALLLPAAACTPGATEAGGGGGVPTSGEAFPVTLDHKYGATTISAPPERVVSIGYQEHDPILALGVAPVAVRYWYGDESDVIHSWAEEAAGDADPAILNMPDGLQFERIAALRPDLILGIYSGMSREDYQTLSRIAPTVAQRAEYVDYGSPWDVTTLTIGRALGQAERAEELVAEVEGRFAAAREAHPHWAEQELVVGTYRVDGLGGFASEDARSRFFTSLGFRIPERLDEIAGDRFYLELSFEEAGVLDADVLVWDQVAYTPGGRATIEADPIIRQLDVVADGRSLFIGEYEDAFGWNTVLSIPQALEGLIPRLEEATGPAT